MRSRSIRISRSRHAQVGFSYSVIGESALARQSTLKAYQLRDRASDVERFFIDTLYDRDVTGNLEREQQTLESWAQTYPRDARPHGLLSGLATTSTGKYELAIDEADKAIALDPDLTPAYGNKAFNQLRLNRLDDAEADDPSRDGAQAGIRRVSPDSRTSSPS